MTVTSISAGAVSFRIVTGDTTQPHTQARKPRETAATDSVELSQQAVAEARSSDPAARAQTVLKAIDTDGDGVVSKNEFTTGALEVLKRGSVRFHHQRVASGEVPKAIPEV